MEEINGGRPAPKLQKPNLLRRLLAFLLTAALVVGAVALVAWRDRINLDSIRRWFSYRNLERSDSGQAETFPTAAARPTPSPTWTETCWSAPLLAFSSIRAAAPCMWTRPYCWNTRW